MATETEATTTTEAAAPTDTTPPITEATTTTTTEQAPAVTTEAAKPAEVVYTLALPKDSVLPVASIEKTAAIARELGLSNEAAQKVLDSFNATIAADAQAQVDAWKPNTGPAWKARDAEWKQESLKDTEIGGTPDKLTASVNTANLVLGKFFDPSVAEFLKESGLGSHREFIRGLARIGKGMSEGSLVLGGPPSSAPKTQAEILYGAKSAA